MFACTGYTTSWNMYAFLIVLAGFFGVAIANAFSSFMPASVRSKITSMTRGELVNLLGSVILILFLMTATVVACNDLTQSLGQAVGQAGLDPFAASEAFTGALIASNITVGNNPGFQATIEGGLPTIIKLLSYSYQYAFTSAIYGTISGFLGGVFNNLRLTFGLVTVGLETGFDLAQPFGYLANIYIDVYYPLVLIFTSLMFVQYLGLVISQAAAFAILLPIALIFRTVSFIGHPVRSVANSLIAIAIAFYIVYPAAIAFDAYVLNWMYTPCTPPTSSTFVCNPSYFFLPANGAPDISSILQAIQPACINFGSASSLLCAPSLSELFTPGGGGMGIGSLLTNVGGLSDVLTLASPQNAIDAAVGLIHDVSQYLFVTMFMIGLNLAITLSFAMGVSKALDSGIEGIVPFWSGL